MNWKEYTNDRLLLEHPQGFYVIKPNAPLEGRPIFCPVCDCVMNSQYDPETYEKFKCCEACAGVWAYKDPTRWNNGWRPDDHEVRNKRRRPDM